MRSFQAATLLVSLLLAVVLAISTARADASSCGTHAQKHLIKKPVKHHDAAKHHANAAKKADGRKHHLKHASNKAQNKAHKKQHSSDSATPTSTAHPSTSSTASPGGSSDNSQLSIHNAKRATVGAPALKWDNTMADYAKTYAQKCVWAHSKGPYGENIAAGSGQQGPALFDMWWQEGKACDFKATGCSFNNAGHYVNIINPKYSKLGCAVVSCPGSLINYNGGNANYLVCEYA